jgi:hypothetical protein
MTSAVVTNGVTIYASGADEAIERFARGASAMTAGA